MGNQTLISQSEGDPSSAAVADTEDEEYGFANTVMLAASSSDADIPTTCALVEASPEMVTNKDLSCGNSIFQKHKTV
eukprot:1037246-Amphidinium_carterae.1